MNLENTDALKDGALPAARLVVPGSEPVTGDGTHEVVIVGTAHVSEKSVAEVVSRIEEERPDIVAVELCPARYRALTGQEEVKEIKISELLSGEKALTYSWYSGFWPTLKGRSETRWGSSPARRCWLP